MLLAMGNEGVKFSVIVPVYNGEKTLERCLSALKRQTIPRDDYEIILVDDGSTDGTANIARSNVDKYLYQKNQGPAAARNLGVRMANGKIVLFTDSDCEPVENWIEEMVAPFRWNTEIVGVKGAYLTKQKEIMARFVQIEYETRYEFMKRFEYIDFIDTYAAAYKKDIFLEFGGFDSDFPIAMTEDTELSYRISAAGHKMVFNPKAFVYHSHPTSFFYYLKRKYRAAYWRLLAVKKNRDKIKGDTHTPVDIKLQIITLPIVLFSFMISLLSKNAIFLLFGIALFLFACTSFIRLGIKKDPVISFISPFIIGARTVVYIIGLSLGSWRFLLAG
ncbi:glycosyltransferase [bacterium]|nr:glycosyltransferase [bacterium]